MDGGAMMPLSGSVILPALSRIALCTSSLLYALLKLITLPAEPGGKDPRKQNNIG